MKAVIDAAQTASEHKMDTVAWEVVTTLLDVPNYVDYILTMSLTGKKDHKNQDFRVWKHPIDKKCRILAWDGEEVYLEGPGVAWIQGDPDPVGTALDLRPHAFLRSHPKYRAAFDLRLRAQLAAGGAILQSVVDARYQNAANEFRKALECEGMRWGSMDLVNSWTPAVDSFRDPAGNYRISQVRQTLMLTCRELRLLTDIPAPKFIPSTPNAQGTSMTVSKEGATGVVYYSMGSSSDDPAYLVAPSYAGANTASVSFTDPHNGTYKIYARTWALDLDGVAHWSPLTTYPVTP